MTSAILTPPNIDRAPSRTLLPGVYAESADIATTACENAEVQESNSDLNSIRRICRQLSSTIHLQAVYFRSAPWESIAEHACRLVPEDDSPNLVSVARVLDAACRAAQRTGKLEVQRQMTPARTLIAIPLDVQNDRRTAVGLCIGAELSKTSLEWLGAAIVSEYSFQASQLLQKDLEREILETTSVIDLIEDALEANDIRCVCQRLIVKLQPIFPNSRIAIGFRNRSQKNCRLIAIEGIAGFDRHSPLSTALETLMNDLIQGDSEIIWTPSHDQTANLNAASVASRLGSECQSIFGIPMRNRDATVVGAIVLLDSAIDGLNPERMAFLQAAAPSIACALSVAERNEKSHFMRALSRLQHSWLGRWKLAIAVSLVAVGIGLCLPLTYKISCPIMIEPIHRRYVAAPFEGTLERALVKPGEIVRKGDLIARMDDREIRWKRASMLADQNQAQKKRDAAQAGHSYADQQIAQLEIDRLNIELQLLDDRVANLEITSPIDGMVTSGDLARVEGAPLAIGQTMFEIAPMDRMIAEVSIADHEIAYAKAGQAVEIQLDSYPGKSWNANIIKVRPRAEIRDSLNVFVAEVELENQGELLRPGMKGHAKIHSDARPYGWILFHQPIEYVVKKLAW